MPMHTSFSKNINMYIYMCNIIKLGQSVRICSRGSTKVASHRGLYSIFNVGISVIRAPSASLLHSQPRLERYVRFDMQQHINIQYRMLSTL